MVRTMIKYKDVYACLEAGIVGTMCLYMGSWYSGLLHDVHNGNNYLDGIWCMTSALVVLQSLTSDMLKKCKR